ncbi:hypothetical protein [Legionella sp. km772]|uniref:hypothetical protein n=1 Tax=Legionella sp. km772 TaxID=2498111 RepID=UPI000F8EA520|nr:hypothetical protein [Legionella sp. km772]RUR12209.1 hypothetical protein ELY15_05785 [Legionella sp. km772]
MKLLEELDGYISSQFSSLRTLFSLIKLEAKLAGLTVFPLVINLFMLFVILISFWFSLMSLMAYLIFIYAQSFWIALGAVTLLNLIILLGLLRYLAFNLKSMSFERTRYYFNSQESNEHEKLEKTTDCSNTPS